MPKGPQASPAVVNLLANKLAALVVEAEASGVVLEVRLAPKPHEPLSMGNLAMVADARAAWKNED